MTEELEREKVFRFAEEIEAGEISALVLPADWSDDMCNLFYNLWLD